ncbi:ABC transporter substrate-binding protein [Streptomyces sp. NA04227]|uniref:ABC transporter substrate-binding protein n=1 Tax=Streptomyces sp. NA04227 TaxID=2742136 RepID=UPI001C37D90D|nr:ABC transporter substrate-binding protein [Streptomyces sp. NA04227]
MAPADREYLATSPPLFLFDVPGSGTAYERRVRRVVEALREALDDNGKLAPYAVLEAGAGYELAGAEVGRRLEFGIPRFMTPDRLPQFSLLRDVVTEVLQRQSAGGAGAGARVLRDTAYLKRVEQGGLPGLLWSLGGSESPQQGGLYSWLLSVIWQPLTHSLPRLLWARRKTRQLIRPARLSPFRRRRWLGAELNAERGKENFFRVMDEMAQRQVPRLALHAGHPQREEALQGLEELLVRALLEDLRVPPARRFLPRRRRRTARPVILVELPQESELARPVERFLYAFHQGRATALPPGPLVIAVGRPSAQLLRHLGDPGEVNLAQAGLQLNQREGEPVLVRLREEPFTRFGLPIRQVQPRLFRTSWRTMTSLVAGATALAVAGAGLAAGVALGGSEHRCVGGDDTVDASAAAGPPPLRAGKWYNQALEVIKNENLRAEEFAKRDHRTVRTVFHFGSTAPAANDETILFDGTVAELRGVAMWQRKLNDDAISDNSRVPLRVEVVPTGAGAKFAEREARKLVQDINSGKYKGPKQVVGVLGYAQSKKETRAALKVLGEAGIPAVGTTATADEMLDSNTYQSYWPFTPANSTEARIAADFAQDQDIIVRREGDGCSPARQAVVIQNSADLYSNSLTSKFVAAFPGTSKVVNFSQDGRFEDAPAGTPKLSSAHDLAETVCKALKDESESVVYWSARARDFTAFVNALDTQGTCIRHDITVLGGNELTNVAQTGAFDDKDWLRLYYSAHRMPVDDARASEKTRQFVEDYDRFVTTTSGGDTDPWRQDGHSAVAYDAFHVLSRAVDITYRDKNADPRSMLTALSGGITFDGATGYVSYGQGSNAPPPDKTLVLLRQSAKGPKVVAACGAYRNGETSSAQGPPCSR